MQKFVRYGIAAVLAVGLLAGCGAAGKASDALPVVTGAKAAKLIAGSSAKAEEAGTARMRGDIAVEVNGEEHTVTMDGLVDFRTGAVQFGMDMSDLGMPGGDDMKIEMRMVDQVGYMRFTGMPAEMRDEMDARIGDKWLKIDPKAMGMGTGGASSFQDNGATSTMGSLRGIDDVKRIGTEEVRGVPTTHYRGHINIMKAMAELPDEMKADLGEMGSMFSSNWPVDVWVDAEGQARKVEARVESPLMNMRMEFEYYDFGTPVDLTAPPPEDVVDFQTVFGQLGAGTPAV